MYTYINFDNVVEPCTHAVIAVIKVYALKNDLIISECIPEQRSGFKSFVVN